MNTLSPRGPAPQRRTAMLRRIGAIAVAAAAVFGYQRIVNSAEPMRTVPARFRVAGSVRERTSAREARRAGLS